MKKTFKVNLKACPVMSRLVRTGCGKYEKKYEAVWICEDDTIYFKIQDFAPSEIEPLIEWLRYAKDVFDKEKAKELKQQEIA